jgi:hypothetical protein
MVIGRLSDESRKRNLETSGQEQPGFWAEAWSSFKYSGLQSPLNGLAQLADYTQVSDKVIGKKLLPKVQFMEAPQENTSWGGWFGAFL